MLEKRTHPSKLFERPGMKWIRTYALWITISAQPMLVFIAPRNWCRRTKLSLLYRTNNDSHIGGLQFSFNGDNLSRYWYELSMAKYVLQGRSAKTRYSFNIERAYRSFFMIKENVVKYMLYIDYKIFRYLIWDQRLMHCMCRMRSILTHRDDFVLRLSVCLSVR